MSRKDIIRWTIDWMLAHEESITEDLMLNFEREARIEWGGVDNRPWKHDGRAGRPRKLANEAAAFVDAAGTEPVNVVTERHGISRRTLYRLLKRQPVE